MMMNHADESRQKADECRRNAAQVDDDVLRETYLDLARRWRMMANQAESLEQDEEANKKQNTSPTFKDLIWLMFHPPCGSA
jgi:hypothetical protein